jgi:uncharacterized protein
MMKILVTGSSGLVGTALISFFKKEHHEVYKLIRLRADLLPNEIAWDPERGVINPSLLEGFDAVVHLAGENIMGRWTTSKKKRIKESRVKGTQLLCQSLCQLKKPPQVLISASAIGYYGNRGDEILTEQSTKGEGFLADVCEEWEEATRLAAEKGIRVVNLRIGMVLSPHGGALKQMLPIFKLGLGGRMGPGNQYVSWVAIDDLVRVIDYAIHQESLAGPLNAVAPYPVTNEEMTKIMGHILHRPTFLAMPTFMVELVFGELGKEVLLSSARAEPKKLEAAGFQYGSSRLEEALRKMLG